MQERVSEGEREECVRVPVGAQKGNIAGTGYKKSNNTMKKDNRTACGVAARMIR